MSHHIVTVCVVCVLCAAHVHCSAHTNLSSAVHATANDPTNPKDPSSPDTQGQLLWTLIKHKEVTYSEDRHRSHLNSNKRDAVRFHDTRYINNNSNNNNNTRSTPISTTPNGVYVKKKITEDFRGGGNAQDIRSPITSADTSVNSRDAELLERLAQKESLSDVNRGSVRSSEDLYTINRSRSKRDVTIDETYFMRKIFEAYGDGTSITMEGFEKLVRKLGLLRLLSDVSTQEDSKNTERNVHKNQLGNKQ